MFGMDSLQTRPYTWVVLDMALGIGAGIYVVGSLINGLLDPIVGVLLVAAGGGRVMVALWKRYRS
jgi:hypothetical protein